jgi:hypothetical protein
MCNTETELNAAIVGVLGTLAGTIVGAVLTYFFSVSLSKKEGLRRAGRELREAFHKELVKLEQDKESDPCDVLQEAFSHHQMAANEFRFHLSESKKKKFDRAWREYCYDDQDLDVPYLEQYSRNLGSVELAEKNRQLAINRINRILDLTSA